MWSIYQSLARVDTTEWVECGISKRVNLRDLGRVKGYLKALVEWLRTISWNKWTNVIWKTVGLYMRVWVSLNKILCFVGKESERLLLLKNGKIILSQKDKGDGAVDNGKMQMKIIMDEWFILSDTIDK